MGTVGWLSEVFSLLELRECAMVGGTEWTGEKEVCNLDQGSNGTLQRPREMLSDGSPK